MIYYVVDFDVLLISLIYCLGIYYFRENRVSFGLWSFRNVIRFISFIRFRLRRIIRLVIRLRVTLVSLGFVICRVICLPTVGVIYLCCFICLIFNSIFNSIFNALFAMSLARLICFFIKMFRISIKMSKISIGCSQIFIICFKISIEYFKISIKYFPLSLFF